MALGVLVGRFGPFVRERHDPPTVMEGPRPAFSEDLQGLHRDYAHHIIPLSLLSRADGDAAAAEQKVIVDHCLALARVAGHPASDKEAGALTKYVACFRPTLLQLDPALHRLEHEPPERIAAFLAAVQAVIEADGVTRPEEARFLANLRQEFANAKA
jgi:hypothetical protein